MQTTRLASRRHGRASLDRRSGSSADAHGGMAGPDELGPPVFTSAVLGIGGYWLVMLWPSRRRPTVNKKRKPMRTGMK